MQWISALFQSLARPLKWWVVCAPWEQGLRVRLGRNAKLMRPGVHLCIPFLDRIYVQSVRLQCFTTSGHSISSRDGKILTISLAIRFQIEDIVQVYQKLSNPQHMIVVEALSWASKVIARSDAATINPEYLTREINEEMACDGWGLKDVHVDIIGFATARCYRLITGDGWVQAGRNIDQPEFSGEVT